MGLVGELGVAVGRRNPGRRHEERGGHCPRGVVDRPERDLLCETKGVVRDSALPGLIVYVYEYQSEDPNGAGEFVGPGETQVGAREHLKGAGLESLAVVP